MTAEGMNEYQKELQRKIDAIWDDIFEKIEREWDDGVNLTYVDPHQCKCESCQCNKSA